MVRDLHADKPAGPRAATVERAAKPQPEPDDDAEAGDGADAGARDPAADLDAGGPRDEGAASSAPKPKRPRNRKHGRRR